MMIINRLEQASFINNSLLCIKVSRFSYRSPKQFAKLQIMAGLYKPSGLQLQHSLILAALTGRPSSIQHQSHGKRRRQTTSLESCLLNSQVWPFLDKFTNELLPVIADFKTPKWRKNINGNSYTLRIRHKFKNFDDFDHLVTNHMHDTYKGVFLPLSVHFVFNYVNSHLKNECYLRMFRLPINMFKRRFRPAFDDVVTF